MFIDWISSNTVQQQSLKIGSNVPYSRNICGRKICKSLIKQPRSTFGNKHTITVTLLPTCYVTKNGQWMDGCFGSRDYELYTSSFLLGLVSPVHHFIEPVWILNMVLTVSRYDTDMIKSNYRNMTPYASDAVTTSLVISQLTSMLSLYALVHIDL